ncbi:hypothetical protein Bcop_2460 [Bacteroides coprosuis DSM 18011]|uniref:Uncharacterized protein n=1 Tax=Bacteroides coprosuis DSM 18011 TaxID=679937 RepID=F3ZP39_9BACE|nr:hypothetical protein Bcop_2460 [Bacteroides coprosuis DSM 18011]
MYLSGKTKWNKKYTLDINKNTTFVQIENLKDLDLK